MSYGTVAAERAFATKQHEADAYERGGGEGDHEDALGSRHDGSIHWRIGMMREVAAVEARG